MRSASTALRSFLILIPVWYHQNHNLQLPYIDIETVDSSRDSEDRYEIRESKCPKTLPNVHYQLSRVFNQEGGNRRERVPKRQRNLEEGGGVYRNEPDSINNRVSGSDRPMGGG